MIELNDEKTEFIVFKSKHNVYTFDEESIQFGYTAFELVLKYIKWRYFLCIFYVCIARIFYCDPERGRGAHWRIS